MFPAYYRPQARFTNMSPPYLRLGLHPLAVITPIMAGKGRRPSEQGGYGWGKRTRTLSSPPVTPRSAERQDMLHREKHSASLCGLNQKPLPPLPSPSAGALRGDTPECDCAVVCVCFVWKPGWGGGSPKSHSSHESPRLLFLA